MDQSLISATWWVTTPDGATLYDRNRNVFDAPRMANSCSPGEAVAAFEKAEELVAKYGIDLGAFRRPQKPFTTPDAAMSAPKSSKPPRSSGANRGLGVGKLAEQLIVERPEWTHAEIADEVNRRLESAKATAKSVRWYASRMRQRGEEVPNRRRKRA